MDDFGSPDGKNHPHILQPCCMYVPLNCIGANWCIGVVHTVCTVLQIFSFLSSLHSLINLAFLYHDPFRCDRAGLAGTIRLAAVRCPAGLAFDINRQTCDWKAKVENCDRLSSMYPFYFKMWQLSARLLS